MSRNSQLKKSKAYKIIVVCLLLLYFGYRIYNGELGEVDQSRDSDYTQEEQHVDTVAVAGDLVEYSFRSDKLLEEHYEKHGIEMGFVSEEEYVQAANVVLNNPDTLHKIEEEDGDDVFYLEVSNEFVVVSKDGYIRTYFCPEDGIEYFNRQ